MIINEIMKSNAWFPLFSSKQLILFCAGVENLQELKLRPTVPFYQEIPYKYPDA